MHSPQLYEQMDALARELFPICRSITGDGVRKSLAILQRRIPIAVREVPTGTRAFDWTVPKEWNIRGGYVETEDGRRILDFADNNLHVVGYSTPIDETVSYDTLAEHLYTLEDKPDAIPYVTSYYKERWGFCLEYAKFRELDRTARYRVHIDSTLSGGAMTYADLVIPGESAREVLFSTNICHPSLGNNELSGPIVCTFLAEHLLQLPRRRYTYRFVFVPETIGSLVYLSRHLDHLQRTLVAGFTLSCVGDGGGYSYVATPDGDTYADRVIRHVLEANGRPFTAYSFLERGSDERQYCSPNVELPVVTCCRSRFGTFPEYHTSLDNLDFISGREMANSLDVALDCCRAIEANAVLRCRFCGEPQLGKRGLYPTLCQVGSYESVRTMGDILAYANGRRDLLAICDILHKPIGEVAPIAERLVEAELLEPVAPAPER